MATRYYIRFRGRRQGPLSLERLHSLMRRGRFGRHYEVSTNGKQWEPASEFPELFEDAMGDADPMDDIDNVDDDLVDPFAPLVDQAPKSSERRRRGRRRDSDMPPDDRDAPAPESRPAGRRKRSSRARPDPDDDIDCEPGEPERAGAGTPRTTPAPARKRGAADDAPAPRRRKAADIDDEPTAPAPKPKPAKAKRPKPPPEPKKKKKGGFFGLFGGRQEEEEQSEHLRLLYEMSENMDDVGFGLEKIILLGAGKEEISVGAHGDDGEGIETLGLLTLLAYQVKSTDIHLEPGLDSTGVRMRLDGVLSEISQIPKGVASRVAGVIKVLCQIDFAGQLGVQEGSYSSIAPGRRTDYRVSFTPSVHGHKVAIRVLDLHNSPQATSQLGASRTILGKLGRVMKQNQGMVLMCGPTGSGKTTTLYSLIRSINVRQRNVMTLEDPVEYQIEGVTQISIDKERGKSFSDMLRALLRQDPDVLLLGEIRDKESAKIALQAAITGHLVLSTVHAQDTLSTVFRLLDLSVDPNMVASSLDVILAQRLVRVLCEDCRHRRRPTPAEVKKFGRAGTDMIFEPVGCELCLHTGFSGRRAIFEMLDANQDFKDIIIRRPTMRQLAGSMREAGFVTLRQHGHALVARGITSFSEVDRVVGLE